MQQGLLAASVAIGLDVRTEPMEAEVTAVPIGEGGARARNTASRALARRENPSPLRW